MSDLKKTCDAQSSELHNIDGFVVNQRIELVDAVDIFASSDSCFDAA